MKIFKLIAICAITLIAASCGSITKNQSYSFDEVRLEMNMNDLVYLGEAEISVEYSSYLGGLFKSIEKVNGEAYNSVHKKEVRLPNQGRKFMNKNLDKAAYKLVEKYPDAVYFQVVFETSQKDKLFLGSINKEYAKVRAYKLKH